MERTRTFTFPDRTTRTIELPYGDELRTIWDSDERVAQYPTHLEAIEAYLDTVEEWLDEGAEQLGPWMRLLGPDGDEVAYRLRADKILSTRVEGVEVHTPFATDKEHFEAMSRWIARYLEKGYHPQFSITWEDFELPGSPWVESSSSGHRGFHHEDDSELEFGPELHLQEDGATSNALYQVDSCFEGMRYGYSKKSGHALVFIDFGHRGENVGVHYFLHPSGIPNMIKRQGQGFLYVFEDPSVDVWLADPSKEHGQTRTEGQVDREEGRVVKNEHEDGREEVTIYYADSEQVARRYTTHHDRFVGTLEAFAVTGELVKQVRFPDMLEPLEGSVPVYELVPALGQGETVRVEIPYEDTLRWWVGSHAHEQKHDNHALAARACLKLIMHWHSLGHIYQGPWIEWSDAKGSRMRVRLPVKSTVYSQQWIDGAWHGEPEEASSHVEALDTYNRTIDGWMEQGMSLVLPERHCGWARPAAHYAELVYRPLPGGSEDDLIERWVHILANAPSKEMRFGSQRETFADGTVTDVPYLADTHMGWIMTYEQGMLRSAHSFLGEGNKTRGRSYLFDAMGHVHTSQLKIDDEQLAVAVLPGNPIPMESITIQDDPTYSCEITGYFLEDPSRIRYRGKLDHDDQRHGRWTYYTIDGEVEGDGEFDRGAVSTRYFSSARSSENARHTEESSMERKAVLPEGFETLSFNAQFGEVRSLLAEGIHTQYEADELWLGLFAMSTRHRDEFFEVAEPYVRESGFLEQDYSVPMYRDRNAFGDAHKEAQSVWIEYDDGYYFTQQCYGVYLTHAQAALLGDPGEDALVMRVDDDIATDEQKGRVLCGIDPTDLLAAKSKLSDKKTRCKAAFERALGEGLERLGITEKPSFYLGMMGFEIFASLVYGPVEEIEGSEGKWADDLDGKGLDVIREHESYDQDWQVEEPAYRCAEIEWLFGQGLHAFELDASKQKKAKKRLSKAGHSSKKEYGYRFIAHM